MAFDIGTTHLKWVVIEEASGLRLSEGRENVGASHQGPISEQNPDHIVERISRALTEAQAYGDVIRVGFSSAMHSFLVVDHGGHPLTQSWTWMDKRAGDAARHLRESGYGARLRERSGVPVHAMSPLVKWISLRESMPKNSRPVALKDYVLYRLTGQWITDYSTASSGGFLGLDNQWLPEALSLAQLDPAQLPRLVPMTQRVPDRTSPREYVVGASDGATAHLHLNIPPDGSIGVLAMGTSGALRTTEAQPLANPELFCYSLGPAEGYLVGSAFSNVGNLLAWMANTFGSTIDALIGDGLQAIYKERPLPLALPYWFGERSPWWQEDLAGAWLDLAPHHGRAEMAAAVLMAMAAQYAHGRDTLKEGGAALLELRGGSGLLDQPAMAQWMADALGEDIVLHDERDASLLGAVDLTRGRQETALNKGGVRYRSRNGSLSERVAETWQRIAIQVNSRLRTDRIRPG